MNNRVKMVLGLLLVFLLGGAIWPAYNFGSARYAEYQYEQRVLEDVRYNVLDAAEAQGNDFFLLTITHEVESPAAHVLLLPDRFPQFMDDEDSTQLNEYVEERIQNIAFTLREVYPNRDVYYVQIYMPYNLYYQNGSSEIIGIYLYAVWSFTVYGDGFASTVDFATEDIAVQMVVPSPVVIITVKDILQLQYSLVSGGYFITLGQVEDLMMERPSDYIYPWE